MRLWTIHPRYLDSTGLVALWRESLLAKKVLEGKTKGYKNHPQLTRFKLQIDPISSINCYLKDIFNESEKRGFSFDKEKLNFESKVKKINVSSGQLKYEFNHLTKKLCKRNDKKYLEISKEKIIIPHPLFKVYPGNIESWEKII